jgi:hypothetical protein
LLQNNLNAFKKKYAKLCFPLKKFFKLFGNFGKDTQATYEQVATGKSYRSTDGNEFIKEINKKKQQGNPLAELKKAA